MVDNRGNQSESKACTGLGNCWLCTRIMQHNDFSYPVGNDTDIHVRTLLLVLY